MTSGASDFPKSYSSFNASFANGNPLGATALGKQPTGFLKTAYRLSKDSWLSANQTVCCSCVRLLLLTILCCAIPLPAILSVPYSP